MTDATSPASRPPHADAALDAAGVTQYVTFELSVLQHSISLADGKASFLLAISSGALVAELGTVVGLKGVAPRNLQECLPALAIISLLVALASAIFTMYPRIRTRETQHNFYWGDNGFRGDADSFAARCLRTSSSSMLQRDQLLHIHALAQVCRKKYLGLRVGLWAVLSGFGMFLLHWFFR